MANIVEERVPTQSPDHVGGETVESPPLELLEDSVGHMRARRARERARAIRGFYIHLGIYLIVNLGIFLINLVLVIVNSNQDWFFYWPLIGWGIAVVINGFAVFGADRLFGPEW